MRKGETTRQAIVNHALNLASQVGLEGLTIGALATDLSLSKSGLFAHFHSKEVLQIHVLDAAAQVFTDQVLKPTLKADRGIPRVRALFENWLAWAKSSAMIGGCIFVAASVELDDRPGPVRDHLVKLQKGWLDARVRVARAAVEARDFRTELDCDQFGHDLYGVMLSFHHSARLLRDPKAEKKARVAFESLLQAATRPHPKKRSRK